MFDISYYNIISSVEMLSKEVQRVYPRQCYLFIIADMHKN